MITNVVPAVPIRSARVRCHDEALRKTVDLAAIGKRLSASLDTPLSARQAALVLIDLSVAALRDGADYDACVQIARIAATLYEMDIE